MSGLNERIHAYDSWRTRIADVLARQIQWLEGESLADVATRNRFDALLERLKHDRMTVAFVAEFSRGKSELINALFLADYGQRMLPSAPGRTTMCPTELMYDPAQPPGIRLLPIETRLQETSLAELRESPDEWISVPFDPANVDSVREAFECVSETRRVSLEDALLMGLYDEVHSGVEAGMRSGAPLGQDGDDRIEVSRWRHAIANLPNRLLKTGLVVVDTPGLNALGAEPELTLNLIPSAHAVVFILAADAGVSRSDIEVWREQISPTHASGRFVVLNKIDSMWDALRPQAEVDAQIARQVEEVARTLSLPVNRIFPVSAQKGLVARVTNDDALLAQSRLPDFEQALSREIVPQRQSIVADQVKLESDALMGMTRTLLSSRRIALLEQLLELEGLRGKNRVAIEQTARRIRLERADFDRCLRQFKACRTVFARHESEMTQTVRLGRLKLHVRDARQRMKESRLSSGLRGGMDGLIEAASRDFEALSRQVDEVQSLMAAMYSSFGREHGLTLGAPATFSLKRFVQELDRLKVYQHRHFGALSLVTTEKWALTRRFFETVAVRLRAVYELAERMLKVWLDGLLSPLEGQVRERQSQLRRRLESVQRVLDASGQLQGRIGQLELDRDRIDVQLARVEQFAAQLAAALTVEVSQSIEATAV